MHGFKNRTEHKTVFFFLISSSTPVFARFLGVLTGPDWLPVPGRIGRSDPVFKTMGLCPVATGH